MLYKHQKYKTRQVIRLASFFIYHVTKFNISIINYFNIKK